MDLFRNKYRIDSARLADWDYSSNGFYFVTICTKNKEPYFGTIQNTNLPGNETQNLASLQATDIGLIVAQYWTEIPAHFPFVELDEFIIMPDHLHGILLFNKGEQSIWQPNKAGVKTYATSNEIEFQWQPRYYDRVIRNSNDLERIRKYISDNPNNWLSEQGNPENLYR
jgi:REP element-mobilizing transposase RayT